MADTAAEHIKRIDRYIEQGGVSCPNCQSQDIEGRSIEISAGCAWQPISCNNCPAVWNDVYKLDTVEGFEVIGQ